jgi:hypothetical protein
MIERRDKNKRFAIKYSLLPKKRPLIFIGEGLEACSHAEGAAVERPKKCRHFLGRVS